MRNLIGIAILVLLGVAFFGYENCNKVMKKGAGHFAGCQQSTLAKKRFSIKEEEYYVLYFNIPANKCKIRLKMNSSSEKVGVYLMDKNDVTTFERANKKGGQFRYVPNFSNSSSKSYIKSGNIPEGNYAIIVHLKKTSLLFRDSTTIDFHVEILG